MDLRANSVQILKSNKLEDRWEENIQTIIWKKEKLENTERSISYGKISSTQVFGIPEWKDLFKKAEAMF